MDEDANILGEIQEKKRKKSLRQVINSSKYNIYDLEEVMIEA